LNKFSCACTHKISPRTHASRIQLRKNAQKPPAAVATAIAQTIAPTTGGISGATLDANMAESSVVSVHTAALVLTEAEEE